jgi:acetyl esterase/lipase
MIRKALFVISATLLIPALLLACASHKGKPDSQELNTAPSARVTVVTDIVYTPAKWPETLTADLYKPVIEGGGPYPGVVMIHGGGWTGRTRADMDKISRKVAARGYVVMNISYRLAPKYHFPAPVQDVTQAVTWLRKNAQVNNVRADRIGAWGYSAGAHLAAMAGLLSPGDKGFVEGTRVQAVVGGGTPVDVRYYKTSPLTNALMGVSYEKNPELWREASPLAFVSPDDPPTFLYHGTFDYTVSVKNSEALYEALNTAHVPTELYTMRGLDHFATFLVDSPVEQGIAFLDRYLR